MSTANQIKHSLVKNSNWQEADQLAIYKQSRGVELGATEKQRQGLPYTKSDALTTRPRCL